MGDKKINLFGTDGIRGIANADLGWQTAFYLGRAIGEFFGQKAAVCLGKDSRISGDMLAASITAGLTSRGMDVVDLGVITTPGLSFIVREEGLSAGVMISASHNPSDYNGLKIFGSDGLKIPDELELLISDFIIRQENGGDYPTGADVGRVIAGNTLVDKYVDFLCSLPKNRMTHLRIAIDAANGGASHIARRVWGRLSPDSFVFNDSPDGLNINEGCGSTNEDVLGKIISSSPGKYDAGFAYDGDGDRCIGADENGAILNGDHIMAAAALYLKDRGRLNDDVVVGTVMSNLGLEKTLGFHGISLLRTDVGDRYVCEEMVRGGYSLGGEQSGHVIFKDYHTTGDGILTSVVMTDIMLASEKPMSSLRDCMKSVPQILYNVRSENPKNVVSQEAVLLAVRNAQKDLGDKGRVLVRPSGTEPLVRIMVEAEDDGLVSSCIDYLSKVIKKETRRIE